MWEWLKNYFDLVNILRVNATKAISYRYSDIKMYGGVSEMKNIHGIEPSSIQLSIRGSYSYQYGVKNALSLVEKQLPIS